MGIDFLILLKQEWAVSIILFILLFIKVGSKEWKNESILNLVNILLLLNVIAGFFGYKDGILFNEMFKTNHLIVTEKNILSLGTYIIALQSYPWLKNNKHILEFYILLLSTLLGMFFMISAGNLLMFYLGLELSSIPLAALANFDLEKENPAKLHLNSSSLPHFHPDYYYSVYPWYMERQAL